jgi:DNA polymerase elongation subunit (family B)
MIDLSYHLKRGISVDGETINIKMFETMANPILQMVSLQDLPMSGWISYRPDRPVPKESTITSCDGEYFTRWETLKRSKRTEQVVPKCMAFDMEVNSEHDNQMPNDGPVDSIFQISCVITDSKSSERRKILLSLKSEDEDEMKKSELLKDVKVILFDTEKQLVVGFMDLISREKPNVLTGFNIFGFDIEYAMKRANRFFVSEEFKFVGFNKQVPAPVEEVKWSSSAYKNQSFKFLNWEGILLLDLLPIIRRDYKLDTYTLKNVTATFLNNNTKDPVTHKDIFKAFRTRKGLDVIGKYCIQDSSLCIDLMEHLHTWVSLSEMSKVCNVSMFTLYTQGQQIKLYSQVYKYCIDQDIVVDSEGYESKTSERYRGAHVIDPIPGFYKRVVPVDFSSLYPSLIIAYNICHSTIASKDVPDSDCNVFEWEDHVGCDHDPKMIKIMNLSLEIDEIGDKITALRTKRDSIKACTTPKETTVKEEKAKIQTKISELVALQKPFREQRQELKKNKIVDKEDERGNLVSGVMCAKRKYRFLKTHIKRGVIPTIIQNLLDSRKKVKNLLKNCSSQEQKIVYDKEQLAYKVSANSMYGAMGVRRGYLPFMPGAMCVTYAGRQALERTADIIQTKFGGKLVYGDTDSNYVIFPHIESIDELWSYAIKVADGVTNWMENGERVFPKPIKLEFENTIYERFLILSKKRYMYQEIDKDGNLNKKIGKKGVILARRDNSQVVRWIYERVTAMIFDNADKDEIINFVDEYIGKIYRNQLEYKDFVITKSVGDSGSEDSGKLGDYKVKPLPENVEERENVLKGKTERSHYISQCPAQVQLAERMKNRGVPVDAGSRIEYVVTEKFNAPTLGQRIEDFEYFKRHSDVLKLDFKYYVEAMINPLDQIFTTIGFGHVTKDLSVKWQDVISREISRPTFVKKVLSKAQPPKTKRTNNSSKYYLE